MTDDPYLWLEDVTGDDALAWVRARNARTEADLVTPGLHDLEGRILQVLDADDRIPYVRRRGQFLYNFWRDSDHKRGLWRRTTLEQYRTDDPQWDVLIDVDALAAAEGENWVWAGATVLRPDYHLALVSLSRGGADAAVVREFDLRTAAFVPGGFTLPEAKSEVGWIDADTVFVGTDFGPGTLTDSGYPRVGKKWRRGTPLEDAETVFEGQAADVAVSVWHDHTPGYERDFADRATTFYTSQRYLLTAGGPVLVDVPDDAGVSIHRDWLLVRPRTDWEVGGRAFAAGSLLAFSFADYLAGGRDGTALFTPDRHTSLNTFAWTANHLVLVTLRDVRTELHLLTPPGVGGGTWAQQPLTGLPDLVTTEVVDTDPDSGDEVFLNTSGYLTPSTLYHGDHPQAVHPVKTAPAYFDTTGMTVRQLFATSDDGTEVPYFVVGSANAPAPTLLYGYGGFENSLTPGYSGVVGRAWLEGGGTYVVANIRGGGEYGPTWHTQAIKEHRHRAFEDFAAVARDLVAHGITTPAQLGAQGGSNGGLLMGVMLTRYPELFGAIVCQVPLLDMRRYHLLLAGASWMAEYGNPDDPADWAYLGAYSPYQAAKPGMRYPAVLITTSTRDDRVHPGHARKMTARLEEYGHSVHYFENIEGGHGGAADNAQLAFKSALAYTFLRGSLAAG